MYNLIKVPRLCDEYHKAERRKYYSDKKEMINEEVDTMNALQHRMKEYPNEKAFFDNFARTMEILQKTEIPSFEDLVNENYAREKGMETSSLTPKNTRTEDKPYKHYLQSALHLKKFLQA